MHHERAATDGCIFLGLAPEMKQHQLSNMRSHVEAAQAIIDLGARHEFVKASEVAQTKPGLTEEMRKMCNMFDNENFRKLGMVLYRSGDQLGDVLLKKDVGQLPSAPSKFMGYCVE